jgi:hypothetical protein
MDLKQARTHGGYESKACTSQHAKRARQACRVFAIDAHGKSRFQVLKKTGMDADRGVARDTG